MLQWLPWTDAAALGAGTGTVAVATRGRLRPWAKEATLMLGLYGLWQYAGSAASGSLASAERRGRWIWDLERRLHLPDERRLQAPLLAHHGVLHLANEWYAEVHVPVLGLLLVWLFARHRAHYTPVRSAVVLVTGASLLVALIPVAPPRLLPALGVVDTGALIGPSTYAGGAPGIDQLSAMPSLHVGWALLVAFGVVVASRRRWRWLAVAYPLVTTWVVVVTGNHYDADALVAAGLCALAALVVRLAYPDPLRAGVTSRVSHATTARPGGTPTTSTTTKELIP